MTRKTSADHTRAEDRHYYYYIIRLQVYPALVPIIGQAAKVPTVPISIYSAFGGVPNWQSVFPSSCTLQTPWPACPWYCDAQSCDQCHPNDNG